MQWQSEGKLTKGDSPDTAQMNARVRELLEGAIQSDGIEELFETGKHISVDIFSDEYMDKINAIQLPNTKIKILQRLLSQAIEEYKKVNRIMSLEFAERIIVCDEKSKEYANYLSQLISMEDDTEDTTVGVKDGSVQAQVCRKCVFMISDIVVPACCLQMAYHLSRFKNGLVTRTSAQPQIFSPSRLQIQNFLCTSDEKRNTSSVFR